MSASFLTSPHEIAAKNCQTFRWVASMQVLIALPQSKEECLRHLNTKASVESAGNMKLSVEGVSFVWWGVYGQSSSPRSRRVWSLTVPQWLKRPGRLPQGSQATTNYYELVGIMEPTDIKIKKSRMHKIHQQFIHNAHITLPPKKHTQISSTRDPGSS